MFAMKALWIFRRFQGDGWDGIYWKYGVATALKIVRWSTPFLTGHWASRFRKFWDFDTVDYLKEDDHVGTLTIIFFRWDNPIVNSFHENWIQFLEYHHPHCLIRSIMRSISTNACRLLRLKSWQRLDTLPITARKTTMLESIFKSCVRAIVI